MKALLRLPLIALLCLAAGCSDSYAGQSSTQTYVLYDVDGCAFVVARSVSPGTTVQTPRYTWDTDHAYSATVMRFAQNDKSTCTLKITAAGESNKS